jgi:hypothetical protein
LNRATQAPPKGFAGRLVVETQKWVICRKRSEAARAKLIVCLRVNRQKSAMRCYLFHLLFASFFLVACAESFDHDEVSARNRAVEFAQLSFVHQNFDQGYTLLSDAAKRYVPREKFKETISRLHPRAKPTSVRAVDYEPMAGEKALYIYLVGENAGERFYYMLTMEGSAASGYKVSSMARGDGPYPSSNRKKKFGR